MSVVITSSGNFGPFKKIVAMGDRLSCDGTDLPFSVIGAYTISEDDGLAPAPPAPALGPIKAALVEAVDEKIAGIYNRWLRFEAAYVAREAAALAYKAGGYVGEPPGKWVKDFAVEVGLTNAQATDLILAQASGLRTALEDLDSIRMRKNRIKAAISVAAAQAEHDAIIAQAGAIAAGL